MSRPARKSLKWLHGIHAFSAAWQCWLGVMKIRREVLRLGKTADRNWLLSLVWQATGKMEVTVCMWYITGSHCKPRLEAGYLISGQIFDLFIDVCVYVNCYSPSAMPILSYLLRLMAQFTRYEFLYVLNISFCCFYSMLSHAELAERHSCAWTV